MTSESDTLVGKLGLGEQRAGVGETSREGFSFPGTQGPKAACPWVLGRLLLRGPTQLIHLFHKHPGNSSEKPHLMRSEIQPHPQGEVQGLGRIRGNCRLYTAQLAPVTPSP